MTDNNNFLNNQLDNARSKFPASDVHLYQHYKGGLYKIIGHTWLTEEQEVGIEYVRVGGPGYDLFSEANIKFTRPISLFEFKFEDGSSRFQKVRARQVTEYVPI